MRRTFALLLAAVMAAGTLTGPAMARLRARRKEPLTAPSQEVQEETKLPPDPEGTVTWATGQPGPVWEPERRVLSENISGIEGIDYDLMYEDLRRQLNDIANAQWYITRMAGMTLPGQRVRFSPGYL